jgi:hypothetical protein
VDITLQGQFDTEIPEGFGTEEFMHLAIINTVLPVVNRFYPFSDELKELLIYYHNSMAIRLKDKHIG